jgi:hypothetical protein
MPRRFMFEKKIRQTVEHIIGVDLPGHYNGQTLPAVLIDKC